ncbi:hypothetical protein FORC066_4359 [Yersinia enterocolitica]|nr:hypothetical protein FORC066_4359 [Yersinia enterocolitica]
MKIDFSIKNNKKYLIILFLYKIKHIQIQLLMLNSLKVESW